MGIEKDVVRVEKMFKKGRIKRVSGSQKRIYGSLIVAENVPNAKIGDVVYLGEMKLIGEIVKISGNSVAVQCYEDTSGLKPMESVINTEHPLIAELGPGLMGNIFDGLEFSEIAVREIAGDFMERGVRVPPIDRERKWLFKPRVKKGDKVVEGDVLGTVNETSLVEHRILLPIGLKGTIDEIREGEHRVEDTVAILDTKGGKRDINLMQTWPVRIPRPYKKRLFLAEPLLTGQRVIDSFFPIADGGTASIPGGFGTGKTVTLHQLAKSAEADIIFYIGCGERGNEMADVVTHFPQLEDPRTGKKLIERTVMIANVSNMPVSAREASIYMGVTIAEYYRDQGYKVAIMADSTSRWAEALRDISGRLEEIPAEAGYPAYLPERIADFYERAGRVVTLGGEHRVGSVTIMGAVSPPGGDFSEPVTATTLRFVGSLWALDTGLAFRRHFPAIDWLTSFSKYTDLVSRWWQTYDRDWVELKKKAMSLLEEASKIDEIARIIGEKALPDEQRLILLVSEMIREGFLVQNAFHEVDRYCEPEKQARLLRILVEFYEIVEPLIKAGVPVDKVRGFRSIVEIMRLKEKRGVEEVDKVKSELEMEIRSLSRTYEVGV